MENETEKFIQEMVQQMHMARTAHENKHMFNSTINWKHWNFQENVQRLLQL